MANMFEQLAERVADIVCERLEIAVQKPAYEIPELDGIDLMRAYSAKEVAYLLGTERIESVYNICETDLPRVKRIGSRIGFLGINVLCYMHGLKPVDMKSAIEHYREKLEQERGTVLSMNSEKAGLKRVI